MPAPADDVFMDRALALAARGMALASPNPMVGAVLVREGRIVGEGFHAYDGVCATRKSSRWTQRATQRGARPLYVTLEPCCHTGRTGPAPRR